MLVSTEPTPEQAIQVSRLAISDDVKRQKVEQKLAKMQLSAATVRKVHDVFVSEMNRALQQKPSSLQMENTYIPELLDGTEEGLYLALDLGGTNFRVHLVELRHGTPVREEVTKFQHINSELRLGPASRLFDFLAGCVSDFVIAQGLQDVELPLGFTFSFPMVQHSLDVGVLVTWTKTFNCSDAVNEDVVKLLREALDRRGDTKVKVVAILNDASATLIQGSALDHQTGIGMILGTGSNASYLERADRVQHWEQERHGEREVIIDIEWGAFGDNGVLDFIKTDFDRENDANSLIVNSFTFEKYISGKYLGELVRLVFAKFIKDGLLFVGKNIPKSLLTPGEFKTDLLSLIEQDTVDGGSNNTREILEKFGVVPDEDDIKIVQYVCEVVSSRSALLVSTCLSTLLNRIDKEHVTIAVDGSLYKHHPRLENWIKQYIQLLVPDRKFKLIHVEDASGKGAALVAAIAQRIKKRLE